MTDNALIKQSLQELAAEETAQLEQEVSSASVIHFSKDFEKRKARIIREEQRMLRHTSDNATVVKFPQKRTWKATRKALLVAALVAIMTALAVVGSVANQKEWDFRRLFHLNTHGELTDVDFDNDNTKAFGINGDYLWIPDGYELVDEQRTNISRFQVYENSTGDRITAYAVVTEGSSSVVDSEYAKLEIVKVNSIEAVYFYKNNYSDLQWAYGNYTYSLFGPLDKKTIIKMAESRQYQ